MKHKVISKEQMQEFLENNAIEFDSDKLNEALETLAESKIPMILTTDLDGIGKGSNDINLVIKLKLNEL